jgi:hypothetical protein
MILAAVLIITVVMIGGMIAHPVKTATGMIATGKIAHLTAGTVPGRLLVAKTIVAPPGLRPPGGRLMIEGLQGTILTDAGTIEDATRRTSRIGPRGTQTEMAVGRVEVVVVLGFQTLARR